MIGLRSFRWKPWLVLGGVLWCAAAVLTLLSAKDHASAAEETTRGVASIGSIEDLASQDPRAVANGLRSAQSDFELARADLDEPILRPLYWIPVVRQQVRSARSLADSGASLAESAAPVFDVLDESSQPENTWSQAELLGEISESLTRLDDTIATLDLGPKTGLLSAIAEARVSFETELILLEPRLTSAKQVTGALGLFLEDSQSLILAMNNAEMRLGSGMALSAGVLTIKEGEFIAPQFEATDEMYPVPYIAPPDDDVMNRWGFLNPLDDIRKVGYTARFAEWTGPQARRMWEALGNESVDTVLAIDPLVLSAILHVIGPVEVDTLSVTEENVARLLLVDQYDQFGNGDADDRIERKDRQALIGAAIINEMGERDWDPLEMVTALRPLAQGRHILAYSATPAIQSGWSAMGISGELTGQEVGAFLLNLGASKLDPFMDVTVQLDSSNADGLREMSMNVEIANSVPDDINNYAAGGWETLEIGRGDYLGRLAFYLPAAAENIDFVGDAPLEAFGPDGQVWLAVKRVEIPVGRVESFRVTFSLPLSSESVLVLPSARFPAEQWTYGEMVATDSVPLTIVLED